MTTQSTQLADAAQLLHDAQTSGIPISPLTQTYPNLDVAQAYSVMGDPAAAVAWLANALAQFATGIEAGQFVMSGSYTNAVFVVAGDAASAAISGLGAVHVSFQ